MPRENSETGRPAVGWRVEMLGGLRALRSGPLEPDDCPRIVERFRTHRTALLLAHLALFSHRAHAREELADLLWPDTTTERGRANLTQTLVYLRQALREPRTGGLLTADHKTVRVTRALLQTDVAEWEAEAMRALAAAASAHPHQQRALVSAAVANYQGDLLPGFYDDWVCAERLRLASLYGDLKERLAALSASPHSDETTPLEREAAFVPPAPALVNAPLCLTRFFGRDTELASARQWLRGCPSPRLLTLLGMGGIGKTRLALEIGHSALAAEGNSGAPFAWAAFVPLAEARTGGQLESVLIHDLGIADSGTDGLVSIIRYLKICVGSPRDRILLILDNLEQLGDVSAPIVSRLLAEVPTLTILATSRQPVGIVGEQEIPIGPLCRDVNDGSEEAISDDVRLFVDRARLMQPAFVLGPANRLDISRLCSLLEGVPLAIELAAAWGRVLTPAQIAERLTDRFALLTSRRSDGVPERHRSLHAAIAWSYDLLEPTLRTVFAQLSVFRGGWTAEAAQAVTGAAGDVTEPLLTMVERSLILVDETPNASNRPARYRMLESLREFGEEQLSSEERQRLALAYLRYFDELSLETQPTEQSGANRARLSLAEERDNLRFAIGFGLAQSDTGQSTELPAHAIRILLQSERIWTINELEHFFDAAMAALPLVAGEIRASLEANLLLSRGTNAMHSGHIPAARRFLGESLRVSEAAGNSIGILHARSRLGNFAYQTGAVESAIEIWSECLEGAKSLKNVRIESALLNNLAIAVPDLEARRKFSERAVALNRIHGPSSHLLASSLNTMANAAREQRDFATALDCLEEAYTLAAADGATGMQGIIQTSFVEVFLETGNDLDRAQELLTASMALFAELGAPARIAEVQYLGFRLAVARGSAADALDCARHYLRLARQNGAEPESLAAAQAEMTVQLRSTGFDAHAEQLAAFLDS